MAQASSIVMAVLIHYLLYSKNFRELFSAVSELPQLIVMTSICLFLQDEEVFAVKYKEYGKIMYSVMEVIVCSIVIEFSLWMVWGLFEQVVTCSVLKAFRGHLVTSPQSIFIRMAIFGFAVAFFKYSLTATNSEDAFWKMLKTIKKSAVNIWNEAQTTNCLSCKVSQNKDVQVENEPTNLQSLQSAVKQQELTNKSSPERRSRSRSSDPKSPIHRATCKLSPHQAVEVFINI